MKTIGLLGGMSWESSAVYYEIVNKEVNKRLGGHSSCKCLLYSVDFGPFPKLQHNEEWNKLTNIMFEAAESLEKGGAEILVICANTMHLMASDIENYINIPLLHIADATALKIKDRKLKKVGLLGTKFTMQKDFYKKRLKEKFGIEVIVPSDNEMDIVHDIIYNELDFRILKNSSREKYKKVINNLIEKGAEGIILGCTEIHLLISEQDCKIPIFDTTKLHAEKAVEIALSME